MVEELLDLSGIGRNRLWVRWVSAAEGQLFAEYVREVTSGVLDLGPFDPGSFERELAAMETALGAPRLRWLTGMEVSLMEKGSSYREQVDQDRYKALLGDVAADEYESALLLGTLGTGPKSVRDMAVETGLSVYTVSQRLGELERRHLAEMESYAGTVPLFVGVSA